MKSKQLAQAIRKIVKEEVQRQVARVLAEHKLTTNSTPTLTEEYTTLKQFTAADARAGFAALQPRGAVNPLATVDTKGQQVNPETLPDSMKTALTRDYTELVKRFNKS